MGDDIINSTDIIERHEELNAEYDYLVEAVTDLEIEIRELSSLEEDQLEYHQDKLHDAEGELTNFKESDEYDELQILNELISKCEVSPDWEYGEVLIHEDFFVDHIQDLINDTYEMPAELDSCKWPWNHVVIDWEGAAEEAKSDYFEVEVNGHTYHIRA